MGLISWLFGRPAMLSEVEPTPPGTGSKPSVAEPAAQSSRHPTVALGPFRLPAPDDPRWAAIVMETMIIYKLDVVECVVCGRGNWGVIWVDDHVLSNIAKSGEWSSSEEDRYVLAVRDAYLKAHPGQVLEPPVRSHALVHLARINAGSSK